MEKKAYILHGCCDEAEYRSDAYPSPSNFHWLPWLQKQLLLNGYLCQTPEMPAPYNPDFDKWGDLFDTYPVDYNTSLIGHSCGAGFLLQWLGGNVKTIDKLILVAPWLGDDLTECTGFLQKPLDLSLQGRIREIHIFYSDNEDVAGVMEAVDRIRATYPQAILYRFADKGHFCLSDMPDGQFPELLSLLS